MISIHNPTDKKITVAAKVALDTQFGSEPGPFDVTPFKEAAIQPGRLVGISCFDIAGYFCPIDCVCVDFAFLDGYWSSRALFLWTWLGSIQLRPSDQEVESIHVQMIHPRQIRQTIYIGTTEPTKKGGGKRMDYPPKGSPAYGSKEPKQTCGGIAAFPLSAGQEVRGLSI